MLRRNPRARAASIIAAVAAITAACVPSSLPPARLGDRVWNDLNGNGVQDAAEPGKEGVDVALHSADGSLISATLTDELGFYAFDQLRSGEYYLRFVVPAGWTLTRMDQGDDELDSDADPDSGQTEVFTFDSSGYDLSLDAGLLAALPTEVPTPTETPDPLSLLLESPLLAKAGVVVIGGFDESGSKHPTGATFATVLPNESLLQAVVTFFVLDGNNQLHFGYFSGLGPPQGIGFNVYASAELNVSLAPEGAIPAYEQNVHRAGDDGVCIGEGFASLALGVGPDELATLPRLSLWGYEAVDSASSFNYAHQGVETSILIDHLVGSNGVVATPGPGPIGYTGIQLSEAMAVGALTTGEDPQSVDASVFRALAECLLDPSG